MPTMPDGYYSRFDPTKNYDQHLFRAGYVLQSAELNEIQQAARSHVRGIADSLFKDGDIIRDSRVIVNESTGVTICEAGAVYISGSVRSVASASITVPVIGIINVGLYLREVVVSEFTDPQLRDPATLTQNYEEAGASRLQATISWGYQGDGGTGEFYPVYVVENGVLRPKEPPPQLDIMTQALAKYDRDSAGGTYVISGFAVHDSGDIEGNQVYNVSEGRARVNGYGIESITGRRVLYAATPIVLNIASEPHTSTTAGVQRITTDSHPISSITTVAITQDKSVTITHGGYTGCSDPLPDTSVLSLQSVTQGGTTYVIGTDVKLTSGALDWSLAGAEPATGSSYSVTYRYINSAPTVTLQDSTGFSVEGAVSGTLVLVTYGVKLPRWDRLCLNASGEFIWITGTSSRYAVQLPGVPAGLLPLAAVYQGWDTTKYIQADGTRMVPMQDIAAINYKIDLIIGELASSKLVADSAGREAGITKGLFVDPFYDDLMRDAGVVQTAAVVDGELILPIVATLNTPSADITLPQTALSGFVSGASITSRVVVLEQTGRTTGQKINPYGTIAVLPSRVVLSPSVDRWSVTSTTWASPETRIINIGMPVRTGGGRQAPIPPPTVTTISNSSELISSRIVDDIKTLRPITVNFSIAGFGPNEALTAVTFDGVDVLASVAA